MSQIGKLAEERAASVALLVTFAGCGRKASGPAAPPAIVDDGLVAELSRGPTARRAHPT